MKKTRNKNWSRWMSVLTLFTFLSGCTETRAEKQEVQNTKETQGKKIQLAILLDTSNSMDGLIDQAKSQLWNIVNEMSEAKHEGVRPDLEIALYEYGNDELSIRSGYIRQVCDFITDLDSISEQLFKLKTKGGSEYCGQVIQSSVQELQWGDGQNDLRMVFIAGNEAFTQGPVAYKDACTLAKEKDIVINTIFCGNFQEGINTFWKDGAVVALGDYMNIDQDQKTIYIESPYDDEIIQLNGKLNQTYIGYGHRGAVKKEKQSYQDVNAYSYGKGNSVNRAISKSKHVYRNSDWDLVDAYNEKNVDILKIKEEDLPEEMKEMTDDEKVKYVEDKKKERESIKAEINMLEGKRDEYVAKEKAKLAEGNKDKQLEDVMLKSVKKQAEIKKYTFE